MTTPPYTANDIADWFLAKAQRESMPLKPMKLQKLVYFAYGWYYAFIDQPLFPEPIYAFRHGPVVQYLFDRFRDFRGNPITNEIKSPSVDATVESLLNSVWEAYSKYTDLHLSDITHMHTPWKDARRYERQFAVMTPESIRDYFKILLAEQSDV